MHLELAVKMLQRAIELDPDFTAAFAMMARAHSSVIHFGFDSSPERDRMAREAVDRALALDPDSADAHIAMGFYLYHARRDYPSALRAFEQAAAFRPDDPDMLFGAALVLRRQGKWDESTRNLEQVLETDPRNAKALMDLGLNFQTMGRYREALTVLGRAEDITPDVPYVFFYQVSTHWTGTGDLVEARKVLERSPPADEMTQDFFNAMQSIYERDYEAAWNRLSNSEVEWFLLGSVARPRELLQAWVAELRGDEGEAHRLYEAARVRMEAEIASGATLGIRMHSSLGLAYAGLGRNEDALREGRRSAEIDYPMSRDAVWGDRNLLDLAMIQAKVDNVDGAFETLEKLSRVPQDEFTASLSELDPSWDVLRGDPRWQRLVERLPRMRE